MVVERLLHQPAGPVAGRGGGIRAGQTTTNSDTQKSFVL